MRQCEWCYSDAIWGVDTVRGHRDLCQNHYDELERERRADILGRLLGEGLAICQDFHNWHGPSNLTRAGA